MSLQEQMIAANIRNWLTDLAIGAKAMSKIMQCGVSDEKSAWKYETKCWQQDDVVVDGVLTVYVFNVKELARAAELDVQHRQFIEGDTYYGSFEGEDFVVFNGVKFSEMMIRKEKGKKDARK